ncbi:MAG: FAD-dependent oxidoreductase [Phycisphaeraceae bacterium]|nr:FAD-dependent oxidoreductase [Phycisphaeraceae bacterium]
MTPPNIAVVGSGVVGLTTAIVLRDRGAGVTVYADRNACPPASLAAPAAFTPYPAGDEDVFRRRTEQSMEAFSRIAREAGSQRGVVIGELREYSHAPHESRPWLDRLLQTRAIEPAPAPCVGANITIRPMIDMTRYMPWLLEEARSRGVGMDVGRIETLHDLFARGHEVVVNCAGFWARDLADDPLVKPMHGQVVHVPNDIGLDYSLHDDAPDGLVAYIFAFGGRLVLGGTFEGGREDHGTDRGTLDAVIGRCRDLLRIDGHPRWRDLGRTEIRALSGIRATRGAPGVFDLPRVEREDRGAGRMVVHNYGHGRSGVTFSWATGAEAADLALS